MKNEIAIEDIAVLFTSEFVSMYKHKLAKPDWFMKMNYQRRRKVMDKVLDRIEQQYFHK